MEDKTFELLTKMYGEINGKIDEFHKDFKDFKKETSNRLTKIEISLENEISPNIKTSLEGYQIIYEKQLEQDIKLNSIDNKLEKQDVEIKVIKSAR